MRISSVALILLLGTFARVCLGENRLRKEGGRNVLNFVKEFMRHPKGKVDRDSLVELSLNKSETDSRFREFIAQHKPQVYKAISEVEYALRRSIFAKNLLKINLLNYLEQGSAVYKVNEFADLEYDEFAKHKLGYKRLNNINRNLTSSNEVDFKVLWDQLLKEEGKSEEELIRDAPVQFDWRHTSGAVSQVKNQGLCGSCWAFSVTGNIEGQLRIKKNVTASLSEEELVDCDTVDMGCNGGELVKAFDQVIKLGGLETEEDYPYKPEESSSGCKMTNKAKKYKITSFTSLPKDEEKLKVWLHKRGPISIGINASAMQYYHGGVSHPWKIFCEPDLDHGVLIVGYGVQNPIREGKKPKPYWVIKNSWGSQWGESGYYRVYRGKNVCGLAQECSTAIIDN